MKIKVTEIKDDIGVLHAITCPQCKERTCIDSKDELRAKMARVGLFEISCSKCGVYFQVEYRDDPMDFDDWWWSRFRKVFIDKPLGLGE